MLWSWQNHPGSAGIEEGRNSAFLARSQKTPVVLTMADYFSRTSTPGREFW
jgi:hypothetical protein